MATAPETGPTEPRPASDPDGLEAFTSRARRDFVRHLREFAGGRRIIHLGYCGHANPGDNAISVAEDRLLREAGVPVEARVIAHDLELRYDETEAFVRAHPGLPILFRGGGMLNDVYAPTGERHARIIDAFPDRPIMEAAQSIHYTDFANSDNLRRAIAGHPDFRLLVRDEPSYAWATEHLECRVALVPDAVLTGTPRRRSGVRRGGIGVAVRHDMEVSERRGPVPPGSYLRWADEPRAWQAPLLIPSRLRRRLVGPTKWTSMVEPAVARARLAWARRQLAPYDAVVADRLHIALVCIMEGIPVVAVDNSYGKLKATFETWDLEQRARVRLVETFDDALDIARSWVSG